VDFQSTRPRAIAARTRANVERSVPLAAGVLALSVFAATSNQYWQSPVDRFLTSSEESQTADATLNTRMDASEAAWSEIQGSPVVGVGLTRAGAETATGLPVHNIFLAAWFQAGILGLLGVLAIAAFAIDAGWRAMRAARGEEERAMARALFASVLAFLLFAQAQPVLFQRYGWIPVALLVALRAQQASAGRAVVRDSVPGREPQGRLVAPAT
jgi:O-antigen ligase